MFQKHISTAVDDFFRGEESALKEEHKKHEERVQSLEIEIQRLQRDARQNESKICKLEEENSRSAQLLATMQQNDGGTGVSSLL